MISYKRALEWNEKNNEIFMMLKEGDELVGTVTFVPLEESTIHSLINDRIREKNIPDWAIRKWTDPKLSVYIATISIFPTGEKTKDKGRGRSLLCYAIRWALALNRQHDIKNWYSIAATDDGEKLLQALGFKSLENQTEKGRRIVQQLGIKLSTNYRKGYFLDDLENSISLIKEFLSKVEIEDNQWMLPMPAKEISTAQKSQVVTPQTGMEG